MSALGEVMGRREALVVCLVLLVLGGWALLIQRRRAGRDLAELRSSARAAMPRSLYELLAWTLASDGRTARLIALLMVLLLLVTLSDTFARVVEVLTGAR